MCVVSLTLIILNILSIFILFIPILIHGSTIFYNGNDQLLHSNETLCRSLRTNCFFFNQFAYQEQMKQNKIQNNLIPFIIENTFITLTLKLIMSDSWISHIIFAVHMDVSYGVLCFIKRKCVKSRSIFDFEML